MYFYTVCHFLYFSLKICRFLYLLSVIRKAAFTSPHPSIHPSIQGCCVFRPAFGCCGHPNSDRTTINRPIFDTAYGLVFKWNLLPPRLLGLQVDNINFTSSVTFSDDLLGFQILQILHPQGTKFNPKKPHLLEYLLFIHI